MSGRVVPPGGWSRKKASLVALLVAAAVLAGCINEVVVEPAEEGPVNPDAYTQEGRDLRTELTAEDEIPVPAWNVGQLFGVHVYIMEEDFQDDWHFDIIVVEDRGDHYYTATPTEAVAKEHSMWDYPGLGEVRKDNLGFTGIGADWGWMYDFPLKDGKTWTRDVQNPDFIGEAPKRSVTFTTTYDPAIELTAGTRPGFAIEGRYDDGGLFIEHDFVPAIGWFANMWMYNNTGAPVVHIESMGFEAGWTGTYYEYTAEVVLDHWQFIFLPDPGALELDPYVAFTVADDADYVAGILFAGALGAQAVMLLDPDGNHHPTLIHSEVDPGSTPPLSFAFHFEFFEYDAVAGEWRFLSAGAGGVAMSFALAWQLWKAEGTL